MIRATVSIGILCLMFGAVGCQKASTTEEATRQPIATSTATENRTATTTAGKQEQKTLSSSLKPEDLSAGKPVPVADLKDAVNANLDAWKGKDVSVVGRYLNNAPTKDMKSGKTTYSVSVAKPNTWDIAVMCMTDKEPPPEYKTQQENRVFKGRIERTFSSGQVVLQSCEYVK